MAFSAELGKAGMAPDFIDTTATVTLEKDEHGFAVTESHLEVSARVPGADRAILDGAAQGAKAGCPISRLLNAKITMNAQYEI